MIYLDSSALLKLLIDETESPALAAWLSRHPDVARVSSDLARVEVIRAVRRRAPEALSSARQLLTQIDLVPMTGLLLDHAATLAEPVLRSLDVIHLASALLLGVGVSAFVVYDERLAGAARQSALPVVQPS